MYGIFDISLDSDMPLPELQETEWSGGGIHIRAGAPEHMVREAIDWFHDWQDTNGEICISCGRIGDDYLLRFPGLADMRISKQGESIEYFQEPGVPAETIRHLLLDQVVPRILGQRGRLVLHASAVVLPSGKGVAFLGGSGWGKSTLSAGFHQYGARLITDDCLLLETTENGISGIPNYYGLRLFKDSAEAIFGERQSYTGVAHYSEKKRLILHDEQKDNLINGVPLDAIFLLSDPVKARESTDVIIEPIKGAKELMGLLEQIFVLDLTDMELMGQQFRNVGQIISSGTAIYRLEYTRDHSLLPAVHKAVAKATDFSLNQVAV